MPFLSNLLLWILVVPFVVLHVILHLVAASVTNIPRFIYRWLMHPDNVLETEYHLQNAYAMITGASEGIGRAIAVELAARGWNLIIHGCNPYQLDALSAHLHTLHPDLDIRLFVQDASQAFSLRSLFQHNCAHLSGPLTLLIHSALYTPAPLSFKQLPRDSLEFTIATNVRFPTLLTHHVLSFGASDRQGNELTPLLLHTETARHRICCIINIGCTMGLRNPAPAHFAVLAASKAYQHRFSTSIASLGVETLNVQVSKEEAKEESAKACLATVGLGKPGGLAAELLGCWDSEEVFTSWTQEVRVGMERLLPRGRAKAWVRSLEGVLRSKSWE